MPAVWRGPVHLEGQSRGEDGSGVVRRSWQRRTHKHIQGAHVTLGLEQGPQSGTVPPQSLRFPGASVQGGNRYEDKEAQL